MNTGEPQQEEKEQLQIETELPAATAKLNILEFVEEQRSASNLVGMNAYLKKE